MLLEHVYLPTYPKPCFYPASTELMSDDSNIIKLYQQNGLITTQALERFSTVMNQFAIPFGADF